MVKENNTYYKSRDFKFGENKYIIFKTGVIYPPSLTMWTDIDYHFSDNSKRWRFLNEDSFKDLIGSTKFKQCYKNRHI